MSDPLITSSPNMSSKKMWIAGGVFVTVVAVALLLYFFVFKKSSKSQPQLQPPSMQMQSQEPPSMKMKIGRRFDNLDNLPIGTGVHCESDSQCLNGCGLVTGDPNKQCCQYGTYNNHFGTVCSNKYCTSDNDCPNGCGLVIGDTKQPPQPQCCTNGVIPHYTGPHYPEMGPLDPRMDPLYPEMDSRGSLNICI